jgi:hypothetical protein
MRFPPEPMQPTYIDSSQRRIDGLLKADQELRDPGRYGLYGQYELYGVAHDRPHSTF